MNDVHYFLGLLEHLLVYLRNQLFVSDHGLPLFPRVYSLHLEIQLKRVQSVIVAQQGFEHFDFT
jgi:hypothetical protein